ncbi:MAG TPA: GNAT family N-acetyltransferase [Gemmatimonadaceae bacterium]
MPTTPTASQHSPVVHDEWIWIGGAHVRVPPAVCRLALAMCGLASSAAPGRAQRERWVRYHVPLADTPEPPPDVQLEPLTDAIVARLRDHADRNANQLRSGLRFWDHGLRRAFIWMSGDDPLCVQWLLTARDTPLIRTLPDWAGMYLPQPDGCGQVENLYTFSTARRKGVATQFEHALFVRARQAGLRHLVTHVHEANAAARGWADRTGWTAIGHITRLRVDVPWLRSRSVFVHDCAAVSEVRERPASPESSTRPTVAAALSSAVGTVKG